MLFFFLLSFSPPEESQTASSGSKKSTELVLHFNWLVWRRRVGVTHSFSLLVWVLFCVSVHPSMKKGQGSKAVISRAGRGRGSCIHVLLFSLLGCKWMLAMASLASGLPFSPSSAHSLKPGMISCSWKSSKVTVLGHRNYDAPSEALSHSDTGKVTNCEDLGLF